jgi:hypothetical protein
MPAKTHTLSPGMGRVRAAIRANLGAGEPVAPPVVAAHVDLRSPEMQARAAYKPDVAERVLAIVKAGVDPEVAAATCGVTKRKFGKWLQLGGEGEEPFATFAEQLAVAVAGFEARLVATVATKAKDDASFALRVLERRFPERWGAKPENSQNVTVNVAQAQITPADARAKMRELFGELAAPEAVDESR